MTTIHAISYSSDLKEVLATGTIQSIFDRSVNIQTDKNQIYTLVSPSIFYGPRQIRMEESEISSLDLSVGQEVLVQKEYLVIGNVKSLTIKNVVPFSIPLLVFPDKLSVNLETLIEEIYQFLLEELDTVGYFRKSFSNDMEKVIFQMLTETSQSLMISLLEDQFDLVLDHLKKLVGLGHGLTPSGDDVLTGLSLVINSQGFPNKTSQKIFNDSLTQSLDRTNIISRNQLELSMKGKSLLPVHNVITAFYEGESFENIQILVKEVMKIGSSSGSDILAGILLGLKLSIDLQEDVLIKGKEF